MFNCNVLNSIGGNGLIGLVLEDLRLAEDFCAFIILCNFHVILG